MQRPIPSLSALVLAVAAVHGQGLNPGIQITPNPAPAGTTSVTVTVTAPRDATISFNPTSQGAPCDILLYTGINGTLLPCGALTLCSISSVPLAPCQSVSRTISVCGSGDFAIRFRYLDSASILRTEWACLRVLGSPSDPALSSLAPPRVGQLLTLFAASPADAGSVYLAGLAFTSNAGQMVNPSLMACLDYDILFALSTSNLYPTIFQNFFGALDGAGNSPPINLTLPPDPSLACLPLKALVAVLDPALNVKLTNQLGFAILP